MGKHNKLQSSPSKSKKNGRELKRSDGSFRLGGEEEYSDDHEVSSDAEKPESRKRKPSRELFDSDSDYSTTDGKSDVSQTRPQTPVTPARHVNVPSTNSSPSSSHGSSSHGSSQKKKKTTPDPRPETVSIPITASTTLLRLD